MSSDKLLKILLVEDSDLDARLLQENILACGVRYLDVHVAQSLDEAFGYLKNNPAEATLLDLSLPDSSGLETIERFKKVYPDMPVLVLTGVEDEEKGVLAVRMGVQDYLVKGQADGRVIARAIRYAIERKHSEEALEAARQEAVNEKKRLEAVMETLPVGMAIVDAQGGIIRSNSMYEKVWGVPHPVTNNVRDYANYKAWWKDTGNPVQPEEWASAIAVQKGQTVVGQMIQIEGFDGVRRFVMNSAAPILDADGKVAGSAVAILDITEMKRMEEELRKSHDDLEIRIRERTKELAQTVDILQEEIQERIHAEKQAETERQRFFDVLETLPVYVVLLTRDYHVPFANRTFRKHFGESNGKCCYEYLFHRTEPCENCRTFTVFKTSLPCQWEWTGPNDRNYIVHDFPFTDTDGSQLVMEMGIDITEQKQAEKKINTYQKRMRSLATEIVMIEERERRTIASALHDSLGPLLAFSKRELGIIRKSAPDNIAESLAYVQDKIRQAVEQTRNLTFDLSPPTLYTLGLEYALEELVEHFAREGRFKGACQISQPAMPLTEEIKILFYRSVRELLVNIVKHAQAKNVEVTLSVVQDDIQVTVQDDGVGFDVSGIDLQAGKLSGFGLFNIYERLIQAGGRIDIQSPENGGIKVVLQLPLSCKKE
jgi:signal transduction histidine kinase/DNA-binding response OmpR family regulator